MCALPQDSHSVNHVVWLAHEDPNFVLEGRGMTGCKSIAQGRSGEGAQYSGMTESSTAFRMQKGTWPQL